MPETLDDLLMAQPPTADRPLLGTVVLLVEDSRFACEAMRLICQRLGARIRRAESLASARRHLCAYRPRIAVVDLGLPDGSGLSLISSLAAAEPRIDGIIAISGDEMLADAAIAAGADSFLPKPVSSVTAFRNAVLGLLPADRRPAHLATPIADTVAPDPMALRDDLGLAADLLRTGPDRDTLAYVAAFVAGLARGAASADLADAARLLSDLAEGQGSADAALRMAETLERCARAPAPV